MMSRWLNELSAEDSANKQLMLQSEALFSFLKTKNDQNLIVLLTNYTHSKTLPNTKLSEYTARHIPI